ncbi:equilibrative nucleoside transporter 3 [Dendroctonus ponderosae]
MNIPNIKDKYYITYGIFYLLGILTFIPNYFLINANRYWMFKFRFMGSQTEPEDPNIGPGPPKERNVLQASFPACYYIVSQLSVIIFILLTAAFSKTLPPPDKRISAALLCTLVFYVVNVIFCNLVTDSFQGVFFFLVMCIACFLGVSSAVILVSLFEMVRKFPVQYYSAILTGQALCGVVSALIQILTISVTDVPVYGGFIFFGIGTLLVLVTIAVYWYSKRNSQYFIYNVGNDPNVEVTFAHRKFFPRIWSIIRASSTSTKMCVSSLIIVVGTTAIVYPGFMSLVVSQETTGKGGDPWAEMYFVPVITFLIASLCDLCGRVLAGKVRQPDNQLLILAIAVARMSFLPLFLFSNALPRVNLPVLFFDVPYILFIIIFSFSNGYLISLCVTLVPTTVHTEEEKSSVTIMIVISAVLAGAVCSFLSLLFIYAI